MLLNVCTLLTVSLEWKKTWDWMIEAITILPLSISSLLIAIYFLQVSGVPL